MKREKFLWPLSQSHHRALLAARRIKEKLPAASGKEEKERLEEMTADLRKLYDEELRLHFWDEERMLTLFEERMGRTEPEPQRIRREHRQLEDLMARPSRENLLAFAELLASHIRFEEDVLLGRIEKILGEGDKQYVEHLLEQEAALNSAPGPVK